MATPRFSILVPTRDRPDTLRHTLRTVVSQPGDDYEVVVQDNCSGPGTRELVESLGLACVRYARSDEVLPMAENWERGLALCAGEYVTVLGDDDGFLPSTLTAARKLLADTSAEILSWVPHTYWWPDTIVYWARNLLIVNLHRGVFELGSRALLEQFYRGEAPFGRIPMIYQAFFHRGLIEEARRRYDGFFLPREAAPDVGSGILGLHLTRSFVHSGQALTVRGSSGRSNGIAQWLRSLGAAQRAVYYREERSDPARMTHPALISSPDVSVIIASTKLRCKEVFFPGDPLEVNLRALLDELVGSIEFDPEAYDDKLADARALAAKLGVALGEVPRPAPKERLRLWGPDVAADNSVSHLHVNCDFAGVTDIAGAAGLAEALLPGA